MTSILLKLQSSSFVSVKALSDHYQVTTRTIYRDLIALEEAGVPLVSEEGRGYSLIEGYNIPPVMFTEAEANALIMAEKMMEKPKTLPSLPISIRQWPRSSPSSTTPKRQISTDS